MKSVCGLALNLKEPKINSGNSSGARNVERRLWNIVWDTNVPQKIRIFASRDASNSLAVQVKRVKHYQAILAACSICGIEDDCVFHELVSCPKVRAFHMALKEVWNIPTEDIFNYSGPDWFLILLDQLNSPVCDQTILMF